MKNSESEILITDLLATCISGVNEDINKYDENML